MKHLSLIALVLFALTGTQAQAAEYPEVKNYEKIAKALIEKTNGAVSATQVSALIDHTRSLVQAGGELMVLYAEKNPKCAEQFETMLAEIPQIEFMGLDEANRRYHDGRGLPSAPRHCYFGRSQVIHPALNVMRLKTATAGMTDPVRQATLKDLEEVLEHMARIQQNLDNPPN